MASKFVFNPFTGTFDVVQDPAGHIIQDEGTPLPQRDVLNFVGGVVTVTDLAGVTTVTINASQTNVFAYFAS